VLQYVLPPLALTDSQLDAIHRSAWPLAPRDHSPFLEAVTQALQQKRTIGDGVVYRVAMQTQRLFWTRPVEHVGKVSLDGITKKSRSVLA
jgi:hypothetical protein